MERREERCLISPTPFLSKERIHKMPSEVLGLLLLPQAATQRWMEYIRPAQEPVSVPDHSGVAPISSLLEAYLSGAGSHEVCLADARRQLWSSYEAMNH